MVKYVASKLQENITGIKCPVSDCEGVLEPEYCRSILPPEVFDRWGNALCEAVILGSEKFYCPYKDCSAMMIDDGKELIMESECPNCRRLFCVQCKVLWHSDLQLRREKIAERMSTLQELVPSFYKNKMDKASVLDEIIEYVKFLQLQLKEAPKGLSLPSSSSQAVNVLASDEIAFKQEVVKLMESDMTLAIQYLQDKGICLMPFDLAAEISREKESLSSLVCEDWDSNIGFTKERFFSQRKQPQEKQFM